MRKDILASAAIAAVLAAAPAWAQSSGATAPAAPTQVERSDAARPATTTAADPAKPAVIAAQEPGQLTAETLIGMDVRNPQDEKIGEIEDLVLGSDMRVEGIVVSVGGFLGMGAHDVALNRDQVHIATRGERNERVATVNMTKDQLKAAPQFKTLNRQRAESDAERARLQQPGSAAGTSAAPTMAPPPARTQ